MPESRYSIHASCFPDNGKMRGGNFTASDPSISPLGREPPPLTEGQEPWTCTVREPYLRAIPSFHLFRNCLPNCRTRSILMYTLYGRLQANEWFSNKMFGVNQLSKTAEGTCNQAGFEQQLLRVCRIIDLMNYFGRELGTAAVHFTNEKQQISNHIKDCFSDQPHQICMPGFCQVLLQLFGSRGNQEAMCLYLKHLLFKGLQQSQIITLLPQYKGHRWSSLKATRTDISKEDLLFVQNTTEENS